MIRFLERQFLYIKREVYGRLPIAATFPPSDKNGFELFLFSRTLNAQEARELRDWLVINVPDEVQIWRPKGPDHD